MSDSEVCEVVWRQFGAALAMLRNAIEACPAVLWERPSDRMGYWYLAYHTLFFVDHDLHPADELFESPGFDKCEYELKNVAPPFEHLYTKKDILAYLEMCVEKVRRVLASVAQDETIQLRGCGRLGVGAFEVVLYELRHVQHHLAQLNLLLRNEGVEAPKWVRRLEGPPLEE